jgi:aspartokinase-like uncharacterized kinase
MTLPVRVAKVGGSLFDLPDLGKRLLTWIDVQPPALTVLLAGGGAMADVIRHAQPLHRLNDKTAHWLCIETLGVTAHWLAAVLGDSPVLRRLAEVEQLTTENQPNSLVFDPRTFLHEDEANLDGQRLPDDWSATSDSIAARLAFALRADELVLLKSQPAPKDDDLQQLADIGYVDAFFPQAAQHLPRVQFVSLRTWTPSAS